LVACLFGCCRLFTLLRCPLFGLVGYVDALVVGWIAILVPDVVGLTRLNVGRCCVRWTLLVGYVGWVVVLVDAVTVGLLLLVRWVDVVVD